MTFVIDKKTKKINNRSTFDRENFMLKFIKTRYFLKKEQNMCHLTLEKNLKYIYKELKKYNETNDVCESLKKFDNTNEIYKFYERATEMNEIQRLKCNKYY